MDSSVELGMAKGALDAAFGHGSESLLCAFAVSAKGREEEAGVTVGGPMASQQVEGGLGEGR